MSLGTAFLSAAAVVIAVMVFTWIVSLPTKNASLVDIVWGMGFALVALFVGMRAGAETSPTWRSALIVGMVVIWGMRLSGYLALRNAGKGEDPRYVAMRVRAGGGFWWKSFFIVFVLQGALMLVISSPVQVALAKISEADVDGQPVLEMLGVLVWIVGLFFETVGDAQLARFKRDPENAGKVMDTGLWKYTRHPNYFGDACVWWGIFLVCASVPIARWFIFGPIVMTVLLTRVSGVPILEKSMSKRRPGYAEYVARTSGFIPRRPRTG